MQDEIIVVDRGVQPLSIPHTPPQTYKSVRWSAVRVPCLGKLWLKLRGELGSGPKVVDDLGFHTYGGFSPPPSSSPPPTVPPL